MWAPLKKDTLDALAAEILHNYPTGFALVAIDGASAREFAFELRDALSDAGRDAAVSDTIPARDGGTLFVVAGEATSDRQRFNFTVWLESDALDKIGRAAASAIVDVSDPEHPRRVFADSC